MVKQQPTKSSNFLERQLLLALAPKLVETAGDKSTGRGLLVYIPLL